MFSVVRLNKFKTDMMYELNRKYLDPYPNCTPYIVACELGHFDDFIIFVTIENIDINSTGKNRTGWNGGYTSLLIATQYEHIDIVKYSTFRHDGTFHGDKIKSFLTEKVIDIDNYNDLEIVKKDKEIIKLAESIYKEYL